MTGAGTRKKVLLHVCCAPCSTACVERLQTDHEVVLFWYNPNLTDPVEHEKRLAEARCLAERLGLRLIAPEFAPETWELAVRGLEDEPEGGARCDVCFGLRLTAAARAAREEGLDAFTTTLSVSPHKSFAKIATAGERTARETGEEFLPLDFKKQGGFGRSAELAAEHGLYRQDYCGCEYSHREAEARRRRRAEHR